MATLTWATPSDITYGTPLTLAQLNATADVSGTFVYSPSAGTILNAGTNQVLNATFFPSDGSASSIVSTTINVDKLTPQIVWASPNPIEVTTALSSTQLNAESTIPGTFSYNPALGTVLGVGTYSLEAVFTPVDQVNINGGSVTVNITVFDVLTGISIAPVITSLQTNNTQFVSVVAQYLSGVHSDISNLASCSITGTGLTYSNGVFTTTTAGSYTVTFTYNGVSATFPIAVVVPAGSVTDAVNPVFWRSHLNQQLLNYYDKNDVRIRENPFTIDAQLLTLLSTGIEDIEFRLNREGVLNLNAPCNVDNGGVYYAYTNPQVDLSTITTVEGLVNGEQTTFTPLVDTLPIPVKVVNSTINTQYELTNPIFQSFTGTGFLQVAGPGILPTAEKVSAILTGTSGSVPNIDIAITGYIYPKPLWLEQQELYTETITINNFGVVVSKNKWVEITYMCVRGLNTGCKLDFYQHAFNIPYKADTARPYINTQRYSSFPRYWVNKTNEVQEIALLNPISGFDHVQSYKAIGYGLQDLAVEPNTYGMVSVNNTTLYYTDRREPMPTNTGAMAITVDPLIGLRIERDKSVVDTFTTVNISPMLYPSSGNVFQYRIYYTDPNGNKTVVGPNGTLFAFAPNNGWTTSFPRKTPITLPVSGTYTFTIQAQDTNGNITSDSYLYSDLTLNPLARLTLPITGIIGVCFDSDNQLWVWDGNTAYPLSFVYNGYVIDTDTNTLYLTVEAQGVTVS